MSLRDMQTAFMQAVFNKDESAIAPYIIESRRLEIYRDNAYAALTKALQAIYPVVLRLVGEDFFRYAARHYIDRYPSTSGDLNNFGAHYAEFLGEFPPTSELAYLPDTARLEWCCHRAYLTGDDAPLDLQRLAAVPPERYGALRFRLNGTSQLMRSPWPIDDIWRVNQGDYHGDQTVDLSKGDVRLLIQRRDANILVLPLSEAEWSFLSDIAEEKALEAVIERVHGVDAQVDIGVLLKIFVAQHTLVEFSL